MQNYKFYAESATCPHCQLYDETPTHIFHCLAEAISKYRVTQRASLWSSLEKLSTPQAVL